MIDDLEKLIRLFLNIIADRLMFAQGNGSQEIETSCEPFYYCDASEFFTLHSSFFTPNYTSVATISSRVPGNISITGISGMV